MKTFAFALLLLVANAAAFSEVKTSELRDQKWDLADIILNAVERLKQRIQDRGLDPFEKKWGEVEYVLISPSVLAVSAFVDNFRFSGLSNIEVVDIGYSLMSQKLNFHVRFPEILATADGAGFEAKAFVWEANGQVSGRLAIKGLGIDGEAKVTREANSGISVTDVVVSAKLRSIESSLNLSIMGLNLSAFVNNWLTNLPGNLSIYEHLINSGLARLITLVFKYLF